LAEILEEFFEFIAHMLGANIGCSIIGSGTSEEDLWSRFCCDFDIHITVVSFEETVVYWKMLFDEVGLEHECLIFIFDDDKLDRVSFVHHILLPY
jgi:hypothetical protein